MKPIVAVVKVACDCGKWVTIRALNGGVQAGKVCWNCGKVVYFVLRGFMKATGYVISGGKHTVTKAIVTYMENKK